MAATSPQLRGTALFFTFGGTHLPAVSETRELKLGVRLSIVMIVGITNEALQLHFKSSIAERDQRTSQLFVSSFSLICADEIVHDLRRHEEIQENLSSVCVSFSSLSHRWKIHTEEQKCKSKSLRIFIYLQMWEHLHFNSHTHAKLNERNKAGHSEHVLEQSRWAVLFSYWFSVEQ